MFHKRKTRNLRRRGGEDGSDGEDVKDVVGVKSTGDVSGAPAVVVKRPEAGVVLPVVLEGEEDLMDGDEGGEEEEDGEDRLEKKKKKKKERKKEKKRRGFGSARVEVFLEESDVGGGPRVATESALGEYSEEKLRALALDTYAVDLEQVKQGKIQREGGDVDIDDEGDLPSKQSAAQARMMRAMKRGFNAGTEIEDGNGFIPLDGKKPMAAPVVLGTNLGELDRQMEESIMDEEEDRWQMEQLRRAGMTGEAQEAEKDNKVKTALALLDMELARGGRRDENVLGAIETKIESELERTREGLVSLKYEIDSGRRHMKEAREGVAQLENDVTLEKGKEKFFVELLEYMEDLLEMLSEKAPSIHKEVEKARKAWRKAGRRRDLRRRKDFVEEAVQCGIDFDVEIASDASQSSSSSSSSSSPSFSDGVSATDVKGERKVVKGVEQRDEFGRDGSMGRQRHMETRRGQRMERRALRRAKRMDGGEPDGWSTSEDESFPKLDAPLYILHDVENDYVKLEIILQRFATWRRRHLDMYSNAYGQDSVAKISVPFAELEIVPWKPLQQPNLENFGFYGEILNYAKDSPYPGDASILPKIVEKIVAPFVVDVLKSWYDVRSENHTRAAITLYESMAVFSEASGSKAALAQLFETIFERFQTVAAVFTVSRDVSLAKARSSFVERQIWSGAKLIRCAAMWSDVVKKEEDEGLKNGRLVRVTVRELLCGTVLPYVRAVADRSIEDALEIFTEVVEKSLPLDWPSPSDSTWMTVRAFLLRIRAQLEPDRPPELVRMLKRCGHE